MYTTGEIAANLCLETPGLDTLDILVLWKGFPTYASTQTIFTILKASWYYLEQNKFVEWDLTTNYEVSVPGRHENSIVVPGAARRIRLVQERSARLQLSRARWRAVAPGDGGRGRDAEDGKEQIKPLPMEQQEKALGDIAASLQASMPPRENPRLNSSVDSVHASGPLGRAHCVIHGNCNYKQTGMCKPTRPSRCCSRRRSGSGSPPPARRSGTGNSWVSCAVSAS